MRPTPLILAALLPTVLAGPAAAQSAISPGYWETTSKVTSPFPTHKTERRCIKPADVAKFTKTPTFNPLVDSLANAHQQDIRWLHTHIRFSRRIFCKALGSKKPRNQFAIPVYTQTESFHIPVP